MLVLITARRASDEVIEEEADDGINDDIAASLMALPAPAAPPAPVTDAAGLVVISDLKGAEGSTAETS